MKTPPTSGDAARRAALRRAVGLLALLALPAAARAQVERRSSAVLLGTVNEPGVEAIVDAAWRWRLTDSASPWLSEAHASLGSTAYLSPSYLNLEIYGVIAPLSVFDVRAGAQGSLFFGTFSSLIAFEGPGADFSRAVRRARRDEAFGGVGVRLYVEPSVQLRVGPLEGRSTFTWEHWELDAEGPWVYEPRRDVLISTGGQAVYRLTSVLLARLGAGARFGARHEWVRVSGAPGNDVERLGGLLLLESSRRRLGLERPQLFVNVFYYLQDSSKKGGLGAIAGISVPLGGAR